MKAGKQIARMHAVEAFRKALDRLCPQLNEEERRKEVDRFSAEIGK